MLAGHDVLAFDVHEGSTHNLFFRQGPVAAHVLATSGREPRLLFTFPAGNTGAGLWFEPAAHHVAVRVVSPPSPVIEGEMRGVAVTLSIDAAELTVRGALLGSVRALRNYARGGPLPEGMDATLSPGAPVTLTRIRHDGLRVALRIEPEGGAVVRAGDRLTLAAHGEPIRVRITALADDPPLTPIPERRLFRDGFSVASSAARVLAFLSYEEKLLAGSWRFLTYFGRDTLLSLKLLMPVLSPHTMEAGLGAVIDRLGPAGDVAHEEAIGEWSTFEPPLDRSMVDDDFLLAPVAASYLLEGIGRDRAEAFLARRAPSGRTYAAALRENLAFLVKRAAPFAAAFDPRALVALPEGRLVGDWRDSEEGLGGGRYPFSVNAALVPAALDAAARLLSSPLLGADTVAAGRAGALGRAYYRAVNFFRVEIPAAEARRRVAGYADAMGIDPAPAVASLDGDLTFPALALDADGMPIPVMHSDDGMLLLFGDPHADYLDEAAARVLRPFPAGLRTEAGLVVANAGLAPERSMRDHFTTAHYHGAVVWSWQHAMYAAGLDRQLMRSDLSPRTRSALAEARSVLSEIIRASEPWRTSELWSVAARNGKLGRVPFGEQRAHHDESNAAQLWSTVYLAIDAAS